MTDEFQSSSADGPIPIGAGAGTRTRMSVGSGDFKYSREGQAADQRLFDSSPCSLYEEYEECSTVRGLWTPKWTPEHKKRTQAAIYAQL